VLEKTLQVDQFSSFEDVCYAVCTALDTCGVTAVLTGGSAATFYAPSVYQSLDLDFIIHVTATDSSRREGAMALRELGYSEKGALYYHATNQFTIDFPRGPLAVGRDLIESYETFRRGATILRVINPTDSVRDRLAAFYHWNDRSALIAAAGVANERDVDVETVRRWSGREGHASKFRAFQALLRSRQ
jgi:hypothetical protein